MAESDGGRTERPLFKLMQYDTTDGQGNDNSVLNQIMNWPSTIINESVMEEFENCIRDCRSL